MIDATNDMPETSGQMPSGSMADTAANTGTDMPTGGGMPGGSMTESAGNMGDNPQEGGGGMPTGNMTGNSGTSGSSGSFSNEPVAGDMPSGNMNEGSGGKSGQQNQSSSNQSQPFELPGTWKIQLVPVDN